MFLAEMFSNINIYFILLFLFVILFPSIIHVFKKRNFISIGIGLLLTGILFFVGYFMGFVVIGFQAINFFCPEDVFKIVCYFFLFSALFAGIFISIFTPIWSLLKKREKSKNLTLKDYINLASACFGIALYALNALTG